MTIDDILKSGKVFELAGAEYIEETKMHIMTEAQCIKFDELKDHLRTQIQKLVEEREEEAFMGGLLAIGYWPEMKKMIKYKEWKATQERGGDENKT